VDTWLAPPYPRGGDCRLLDLLAEAGVLRGTASQPEHQLTAAGRWLAGRLREQAPVRIAPDWPAAVVLEHLQTAGADTVPWSLAGDWCWAREPVEAARHLLGAAADADAATRALAVRLVTSFGEQALPAWREVLASDHLGPHARRKLSWWEEDPAPVTGTDGGSGWNRRLQSCRMPAPTRHCRFWPMPPAAPAVTGRTRGSCSPRSQGPGRRAQADPDRQCRVTAMGRWALRQTRGGPGAGEPVLQLRIELVDSAGPDIWRQVLVPARYTLAELHAVIQAAVGWQDAHLHQFRIGDACHGPRGTDLDLTPEDGVRLDQIITTEAEAKAGARAGTQTVLDYLYDFGDDWEHRVSVETVTAADPGSRYPRCTGGHGACATCSPARPSPSRRNCSNGSA
jgi:hypothetical protein